MASEMEWPHWAALIRPQLLPLWDSDAAAILAGPETLAAKTMRIAEHWSAFGREVSRLMGWSNAHLYAASPYYHAVLPDNAYPARRCYVLSGTGPTFSAPAAGGPIHGVSNHVEAAAPGYPVIQGWPVRVEASAAFAAGAALVTGADGRVAPGGGTVVLQALEASSGAGATIAAVFP